MIPRYKLTLPANNDLHGIARYTKEPWGAEHAKKYLKELRNALGTLAQTPKIGRLRKEVAPGLRSFTAGSYIVFYKKSKTGITVARVLHSKSDIERQLDRGSS